MSTLLASDKQISYYVKLMTERGYATVSAEKVAQFTSKEISTQINQLLKTPRVLVSSKPILEDGIYIKDGVVYKVQTSGSDRKYAKVLQNGGGFSYVAGAISSLTAQHKITLEQAKAYGIQFGVCCVCGALLTDAKSVDAGIGPVCAKKWN